MCHRRFGKSVMAINELIKCALSSGKADYRGAYVAPFYKQAKQVAWDYLKKYSRPIPGVKFNEAELRADYPNGARVSLFGADNPDALRGLYLDDVVLDEVAQMPRSLWGEVIRPLLSDRQGNALFLGTPKGHNFFWEVYQRAISGESEWSGFMFKASETNILPEAELASAKGDMTLEEFDQEYECSFQAAIKGSYYGKLLGEADQDKRIGKVPHDPALPVHTFWDLGVSDSTAIWFVQQSGRETRIIDYYEASGVGLEHYAKVLQDKGFLFGQHYAPHDIRVRELGSGKSRLEIAQGMGIRFEIVPQIGVMDGINAARLLIPRCWFDADKCRDGIEALRQYRTDYDEKTKTFRDNPKHDWTSHAADAFRYVAVGLKELEAPRKKPEGYSVSWMG